MGRKKFVWITKGQKEFILFSILSIFILLVFIFMFSADQDRQQSNYEKYGIMTSDPYEIQCFKTCGHKNYFYQEAVLQRPAVCECGVSK